MKYSFLLKIVLSLILITVFSSVVYASLPNTSVVVEHWDFEDDYGYFGRYNMTSTGEAIVGGIIGNAYDLENGEGDIVSFALQGNELTDKNTINCWVKQESNIHMGFFHSSTGSASSGLIYYTTPTLRLQSGWAQIVANQQALYTGVSSHLGEWKMITGVRNGTSNKLKLYLNGTLVASSVDNAITLTGEASPFETRTDDENTRKMDGIIDECTVYNDSLSSAVIAEMWNSGSGVDLPFTIGVSDTTPPTNSTWNVTSNVFTGEESDVWNTGDLINITANALSYTVTLNEAGNGTCRLDTEQNYTQMFAANVNYKHATTETTSQAGTLYDNITYGNHCMYCSWIDASGNEPASGSSSSGCLNLTYWDYPLISLEAPANATVDDDGDVTFVIKPIWNVGNLVNCTSYHNITGSFIVNQTFTNTDKMCYQESANVSNQTGTDTSSCNLDYNGKIMFNAQATHWVNPSNFIDGNWTTFAEPVGSQTALYFVNYSKPTAGYVMGAKWRVMSGSGAIIKNYTLPESCVRQDSDQIELKLHGREYESATKFYVGCYNGTDWHTLNSSSYFTPENHYEEAIWWNMSFINNTNITFDEIEGIDEGNYIWNAKCCNSKDMCSFSEDNYTFSVAIDASPVVTLNNPTDDSNLYHYIYNTSGIVFNHTVTDDSGFTNCSRWDNSSGTWAQNQTNQSVITNNSNYNWPAINLSRGCIIWNVKCYDDATIPQSDWATANYTLCLNNSRPDWDTNISNTTRTEDFGLVTYLSNLTSYASDADGDTLYFTIEAENTSQVDCFANTTSITLTSYANYSGNASCVISVNDSYIKNGNSTFWIEVTAVNDAPYFDPALVEQSTNTSATFSYDINCSDADPLDTITYYDNSTLYTINSGTGIISQLFYERYKGTTSNLITCGDGTVNTTDTFDLEINDTTNPRFVTSVESASTVDFCGTIRINATFDDWYMGNGATVYFRSNKTGTYTNYTATYLSSLNDSRTSYYYDIPSNWTSAGKKYYEFVAVDNASNVNNSMPITDFNVTQNTTSTVILYLDGTSANRKYELSYGSNLTGIFSGCTDETIWLDIGDPNYGINYTHGNGSVYYNYDIDDITEFRFSDLTESKNLTFTSEGNQSFYIQLPAKATISSAYIVINGTNYSANHPTNVKIDVINDSTYDIIIPGTLIGNTSNQSTFTNGESKENLSFVVPGTIIRYINVSANAEGFDLGFIFPNITMNISGYAIDPTGLNLYDYFDNESYNYRENTCQGPLWIWDDFSQGDVTGRWAGDDYAVVTDNYVWHSESVGSCSQPSYDSCCTTCAATTENTFYSQTMAIEESIKTELKIKLIAYEREQDGGSCSCNPDCKSNARAGIRDKTTGTASYFMGGTCNPAGDWNTCTWDSIVEVKKEDGYLKWYEDDVFVNRLEYDSTHQYEVVVFTRSNYQELFFGETASCSSVGYIYYINKSGATGNGSMDSYGNCSITYPILLNVSQSDNISKATFDLGYDEIGSAGDVSLFLSNNNGTTWETATDNIVHVFTSKGSQLTARINMTTTETDETLILNLSHISVTPGWATGIGIDVGYDGDNDYTYDGVLNTTNSPQYVSLRPADVKNYIADNCLGRPTCSVPLAFNTETSGSVEYSILNIEQEFSKVYLNNSRIDDYLTGLSGNNNVTFRVHSNTAGIVQLSGINIDYKGGANYSIKAHFQANENYTALSDTEYLAWRYSPLTANYPTGIDYYNVYPGGLNSKAVSPYGQYLRVNESESVGIWNMTHSAKDDDVKLYRWFNPEVDSCLVLYTCEFFNKTSCNVVNSTTNQTVVKENMENTTAYKLYDFWNLTSCDPDDLFLPGNFTFRAICQDCVRTW